MAAFSAAPADGDTIWVGRIPSKLKTKAFLASGGKHVQRYRYCWLMFEPTSSARSLLVRMYDDYSSTAKTWGTPRDADTGITFPGKDLNIASSDWKVSTSLAGGVARIGIGDFKRAVEIEIEIKEPDAAIEIFQIELDGEEGERTA